MAALAIVQYEVYVREQGRWYLHARYRHDDRDGALDDARNTESMTGRATKVIRDVYNPETRTNDEAIVYVSPRLRPTPIVPSSAERQATAARALACRRKERQIKGQPDLASQRRSLSPAARLFIFLVIGCFAAAITALLPKLL